MKKILLSFILHSALLTLLFPVGMNGWSDCRLLAQDDKADLILLEGHRLMMKGNNSDAFELMRHSLMINPKSATTLDGLSQFWHYMRNDSMAIECLKLAAEYDPDNYWTKQSLVGMYIEAAKVDEAIRLLEQLSEQFPAKEEVLMMLEGLYKQNGDYENVVKILDKIEVKEGKSEQLSMEKFRIYVQMNDEAKAFAEMSDLADEYPNDMRYRVLVGDLYRNQGKYDEALKQYEQVRSEDSTNIYLMASMLNYYKETNQDSLYQQMVESISMNERLDDETRVRFLNGLVYENLQNSKDPGHLLAIFDKVLKLPQHDIRIAELCARYMITLDMPVDEVTPVLNQMLDIDPENILARSQLLQYATEAEDTMEVIRVCRPAVDYNIDDPVFYYYLGIAYFQTDSVQLAINTFKKGFTHVKDDTNLQLITNMYALIGDSYHKMGDMRHAYENYDSCLMYRPDEALVLNNYAYYLSLERKQLDKAEEMSRRSLEKEGDNHTYLDTYAWILFQQKKYAEAKVYIDQAISLMGDSISAEDANIIEHAGDIYAKNKLMDKAMEYWQMSADLGNDSATLAKKIRKRKYYDL